MSFLSRTKNKKETVLILDIGSGSVAGAIVELEKEGIPRILYTKRVPIKFLSKLSGERFKKSMLEALSKVLENISKKGLPKTKKAYYSLASPWFVSQTRTVVIKEEKPFVVTERLIAETLEKERTDFENSGSAQHQSNKKKDSEVIETKILDIKLNGYKVKNPIGKKAEEIEFSVFLSMSQTSILDSIEDLILSYFDINEANFYSFTLVSFSAIRDMHGLIGDFIMLDITGEVTDISMIKSGSITKTMSFPVGKNSVIRDVAEKLKTTPNESLSSLRLFFADSLNEKKSQNLKKILSKSEKIWSEAFQKAAASFGAGLAVPKTVFFTADSDFSSWYKDVIKKEGFIQSSMAGGPFTINIITLNSLKSHILFGNESPKDVFIAVESVFFNRLFELER